jgi:predicted phosphodiesterase
MRIAFVSDVHGNLPAFQAVLAELDTRGPFDALVGGGDFAFGGVYPARCIAVTRERGFQCVRGNTDEWVVESYTAGRVPAREYGPAEAHGGAMLAVDDWVARLLNDDAARWLSELPIDWRVTGPSGQRLTFVHATPWSTHPQFLPDDEEMQIRILDASDADFVVHGHNHRAYIRQIAGRTIVGAGSVGMPFDGNPLPAWLIGTDDGSGWSFEHVRTAYDRDGYLAELARSGIPNSAQFINTIRAVGQ